MMNYIKKIAIYLFDLIDKYIHQKNILKNIKKEKLIINTFIDIGAHKGKYTDLFINNYKIRNIYMFEPQSIMFNYIKKKYRNNKIIKSQTTTIFFGLVKNVTTIQDRKKMRENVFVSMHVLGLLLDVT